MKILHLLKKFAKMILIPVHNYIMKLNKEALVGISFVFLWIIGFLFFTLYPLINSIIYSFNQVIITPTGIEMKYIGFDNYKHVLTDIQMVNATIDFFRQLVINVPIIIVISIIIAMLLNQKIKCRGLFRSIYFLPVIITSGPVVNELINKGATKIPLLERYGVLEIIAANLSPKIANPIITMFSQVIIILWFSGVQILIILAGLQKMDSQVYEAARIDGASPWETFWKVTLPSLKNLIIINIIYTIVTLSTFPGNNEVINLILSSRFASGKGYGYSTASSWLYFFIVFLILALSVGIVSISGRSKYRK